LLKKPVKDYFPLTPLNSYKVYIHFVVKDSGIGILSSQKKAIFGEFVQGDESTTRRYGGTGLGLSITHKLVSAMGGEIALESTVGVGSSFSFSLGFDVAIGAEADAENFSEPRQGMIRGRCFLVVDDVVPNQLVVRMILEQHGGSVEVAGNGLVALDKIAHGRHYDAILMDLHMPEMDGLEATRKIREEGNSVPIVVLTASVEEQARQDALAVGANAVLHKPVQVEQLEQMMWELFHGRT